MGSRAPAFVLECSRAPIHTAEEAAMLDTDSTNTDEISRATAPELARWFYRDRLAEGYNPTCARCMAILYLRRKTGLSWPLAAGSFDSHNTDGNSPT